MSTRHHEPGSIRAVMEAVRAKLVADRGVDAEAGYLRDVRVIEKDLVNVLAQEEGAVELPAVFIEYAGGDYGRGGGSRGRRHAPQINLYVAAYRLVSTADAVVGHDGADGAILPEDWGVVEILDDVRKVLIGQTLGQFAASCKLVSETRPS